MIHSIWFIYLSGFVTTYILGRIIDASESGWSNWTKRDRALALRASLLSWLTVTALALFALIMLFAEESKEKAKW